MICRNKLMKALFLCLLMGSTFLLVIPIFAAANTQDSRAAVQQLAAQQLSDLQALAADGITVVLLGDQVKLIIPDDYLFQENSNDIKRSACVFLNRVVSFLKLYGNINLSVIGHSDSVGTNLSQIQKTNLQAQQVASYLWTHGISIARIRVLGLGNHQQIADPRTIQGNAYNRRVEIQFWRAENQNQADFTGCPLQPNLC